MSSMDDLKEEQRSQPTPENEPDTQESACRILGEDDNLCNTDSRTEAAVEEDNCTKAMIGVVEKEEKNDSSLETTPKENENIPDEMNDTKTQNQESSTNVVNTVESDPLAVSNKPNIDESSNISSEPQKSPSIVQLNSPTFVTKQLILVKKIIHTKPSPSVTQTAISELPNAPNQDSSMEETGFGIKRKREKSVSNGVSESSDSSPSVPPEPLNKRRRNLKSDGSYQEVDRFCWMCHRDGVVVACATCPRVYHLRCVQLETTPSEEWVCPECITILNAENVETRSRAMRQLTLDQLCNLLKYALHRMKAYPGTEPFSKPVDQTLFPRYHEFVAHPMDLSQLERNIRRRMYGSTEAFIADTKWILHDCIIFNTNHTKLSSTAKAILKICKQEMSEIEICPDCYLNAHTRKDSWFIEVCRKPHVLLWAKLKGYPFWPAKVMRTNRENMVDVRFFGAHDRAWVPVRDCFLYSESIPTIVRNKKKHDLDACILEVEEHIKKLRDRFGHFEYAPFRTSFDPEREEEHLTMFLPGYAGENAVSQMPFQHRFRPRILRKPSDKASSTDANSRIGGFRVVPVHSQASASSHGGEDSMGTSADEEGDDKSTSMDRPASAPPPSPPSSTPMRPLRVYGRRRPSPGSPAPKHSASRESRTKSPPESSDTSKEEPEEVEPSKIGSALLSEWASFERQAARITMRQQQSVTGDGDVEEAADIEIIDAMEFEEESAHEEPIKEDLVIKEEPVEEESTVKEELVEEVPASPTSQKNVSQEDNPAVVVSTPEADISVDEQTALQPPHATSITVEQLGDKDDQLTLGEKRDKDQHAPAGDSDAESLYSLNITEDDTSSLSSASENQEMWTRMSEEDTEENKDDIAKTVVAAAASKEAADSSIDSEKVHSRSLIAHCNSSHLKRSLSSDAEDSNANKAQKLSPKETISAASDAAAELVEEVKAETSGQKKADMLPYLIRRLHCAQPRVYKAPPASYLKVGAEENNDSEDKDDSNAAPEGDECKNSKVTVDFRDTNSPVGADSNSNTSLSSSSSSESSSSSSSGSSSNSSSSNSSSQSTNSNSSSSSSNSSSNKSESTSGDASSNTLSSGQKEQGVLTCGVESPSAGRLNCEEGAEKHITRVSEGVTDMPHENKEELSVANELPSGKRSGSNEEEVSAKKLCVDDDLLEDGDKEPTEMERKEDLDQICHKDADTLEEESGCVEEKDTIQKEKLKESSHDEYTGEESSVLEDDREEKHSILKKSDDVQMVEKDEIRKVEKEKERDEVGRKEEQGMIHDNDIDLNSGSDTSSKENIKGSLKQGVMDEKGTTGEEKSCANEEKDSSKIEIKSDREENEEREKEDQTDTGKKVINQREIEKENQKNITEEIEKAKETLQKNENTVEIQTYKDIKRSTEEKGSEKECSNKEDNEKMGISKEIIKETQKKNTEESERETQEYKKVIKVQSQLEIDKEIQRERKKENESQKKRDIEKASPKVTVKEIQRTGKKDSQKIKGNRGEYKRSIGDENQGVSSSNKEKCTGKENQRKPKISQQVKESKGEAEKHKKQESLNDSDKKTECCRKEEGEKDKEGVGTDKSKVYVKEKKGERDEVCKEAPKEEQEMVKKSRKLGNKEKDTSKTSKDEDLNTSENKNTDIKATGKKKEKTIPESGSKATKEGSKRSGRRVLLLPSTAHKKPPPEPDYFSMCEMEILDTIKQEPMDIEEDALESEEEQAMEVGSKSEVVVESEGAEKSKTLLGSSGLVVSRSVANADDRDSPTSLADKDNVLPSYLYPSVTITVDNDKHVETNGPSSEASSETGTMQGDGTINIEEVKASVGLPSAISLSVIASNGGLSNSVGKETSSVTGGVGSESPAAASASGSDNIDCCSVSVPTIVTTPSGLTVTAHNGLQISTQPAVAQPPLVVHNKGEISAVLPPVRGRARKSFPNRPHPQVKITQSLMNGPGKGPGRRGSGDARRGTLSSLPGDALPSDSSSLNGDGGMVFIPTSSSIVTNGPLSLLNGDHSSLRPGASLLASVHQQAVTQAGGHILPHMQVALPSSKCNSLVPAEAGPVSAEICNHAQKMAGYMQLAVEEMLRDMSNVGNLEASTKMLQLELEKVHWRYQAEIAELKHNTDLRLIEMRAGMMSEQQRAVAEAVRQCEIDKQRAIEETKKKQWCTNCGKEALFYCCWNTSYCDYPCQQRHWPQHMASCGQAESMKAREAAENGVPQGASPAAALVHHAPSSKAYNAAGPQPWPDPVPNSNPWSSPSSSGVGGAGGEGETEEDRSRSPSPPHSDPNNNAGERLQHDPEQRRGGHSASVAANGIAARKSMVKRKRCGRCAGCSRSNCGRCPPCLNSRTHQVCRERRCSDLQPVEVPLAPPTAKKSQMSLTSAGATSGKAIAPTGVPSHRPRGPTPPYGLMPMPRPPMQGHLLSSFAMYQGEQQRAALALQQQQQHQQAQLLASRFPPPPPVRGLVHGRLATPGGLRPHRAYALPPPHFFI